MDADARVSELSAAVNPQNVATNKQSYGPYGFYAGNKNKKYRPVVQKISFDVVVTASE